MRLAIPALAMLTLVACGDKAGEHLATLEAGTPAIHDDAGAPDADVPDTTAGACDAGAAYPSDTAMSLLAPLPDLSFAGQDAHGANATIAMHDYFEPCAAASRLLVVRVSASWCGTCAWHAAHTSELLALDVGPRLVLLDMLVAGDDNLPATLADVSGWRARIDGSRDSLQIAVDPSIAGGLGAFGALNTSRAPLPLYVFVDTRTMMIRNRLANPDPDLLALRIHQELATLDGGPNPTANVPVKMDGRFTRDEWDMVRAMAAPTPSFAPPPDPTNAHGDDPNAAALGKQLFSDTTLTPTDSVSCGKCHDSGQAFTDSLPQSVGVSRVDRNAPSLLYSAWSRFQFWDGRADTLWMQALGPLENEKEMASSRLFVAHAIYDRYRAAYEATFGAMPALSDATRFPPSGKPGDAAWTAMSAADQSDVNRVFVNVGKSMAAFERSLRAKTNALDAYAGGDLNALNAPQKDGLSAFFKAGCAQCHYGPRLTDDAFHAVRFPTGRQDGAADRGRIDGVPQLLASDFNAAGAFSDAPHAQYTLLPVPPSMLGAFKTPTLRGIAQTAPYGHGGTLATLADVAKNYETAGLDDASALAVGVSEPWLPKFDDPTRDALPPFLEVLSADVAP